MKLAILTSHPIQYQAPFFKKISKQPEIDLIVYFCWDTGIKAESYDEEFGKKFSWDIPLLEGYKYKFLRNLSFKPSSKFWGQVNFGIIWELFKSKPDAILIFGWNSFSNWLAFLAAFIAGIPVFLRGENPLNQELLKSKWKIAIKKIVLSKLFSKISAFLYIGEENKKFYKYYGIKDEKLFFVPYAVDNERYIKENQILNIKNQKLKFRKELDIGEKDIVILFVGKLIEKKRPLDLLKAYRDLITQLPNYSITLLFVGDGMLRPELENYAKENNLKNVIFAGFKNQTELPQYYAISDVFVLPSGIGETWGLVTNEAMCFGLPIIVSDVVGCGADLVRNNQNGFIFKLGDIRQLSNYLSELINDKKKRTLFGKKSLEIIENYDYEEGIRGIKEALIKVLN